MPVLPLLGRFLHPARAHRPRPGAKPRGPNRLEAAAWFAIAVAILAWGRGSDTPAASIPPRPKPFLRRLWSDLTGIAPIAPDIEVKAMESRQPGRGRDARFPSQIPAKGWRDIAWRTWKEFNRDRIPAVAGGVTFFCLLALFPAMAAFVSLYGLFSDVHSALRELDMLSGLLPPEALGFVGDQMIRLATSSSGRLGAAFVISLILSLWSANAGVKALLDGLNVAYEERERRGYIRLNLISLAFTGGALVFVFVAIALVLAAPATLALVGYAGPDPMRLLRWPLLLAMIVAGLELLYRHGPSRQTARWRWVSWGGVAAALLWIAASMAFSWYVANFGHFNRTYGSLGAPFGFMTWMWISMIVVLLGAELNAEIEHQTAVDSTTGAPELLGRRGARMADTLGQTAKAAGRKPDEPKQADPRLGRSDAARPNRRRASS